METIQEIKNNIAIEKGYKSWLHMMQTSLPEFVNEYFDKAAEIYADQFKPSRVLTVGTDQSRTGKFSDLVAINAMALGKNVTFVCADAQEAEKQGERLRRILAKFPMTFNDLQIQAEFAKTNIAELAKVLKEFKVKQIEPPRNVIPKLYLRGTNNFKKK